MLLVILVLTGNAVHAQILNHHLNKILINKYLNYVIYLKEEVFDNKIYFLFSSLRMVS